MVEMGILSRMAELADRIDRFNAAIGRTAAWAGLFIVLVQFAVVVLRYAFGIDPWISIAGLDKDEWRRRVEAWRTLGASHVAVDTMRAGFTSPQAHIAAIRSFREVLS